jgi:predicted GNAT family acetyltransferase
MDAGFYLESINQHGLLATLYHAAYRGTNQLAQVAAWNALVLKPDHVDAACLVDSRRRLVRWLDAEDMRRYTRDEASQLTDSFLDDAKARGDRCVAVIEDGILMHYGWYSARPCQLSEVSARLTLHFDPSYAYVYNVVTLPEYRGQRLHAVAMGAAIQAYVGAGRKGLLCYVDSSNHASLRAFHRVGFEDFGHILLARAYGRYLCHCTTGCGAYDVRVERSS